MEVLENFRIFARKLGYIIYFFKVEEFVKIGKSNNISNRADVFNVDSPFELELLGTVSGDLREEKLIHSLFHELRTKGEWFKYDKSIIDYIEINKCENSGLRKRKNKTYSNKLRNLRLREGFTLKELAKGMGVHHSVPAMAEKKFSLGIGLNFTTIVNYASFLGYDVDINFVKREGKKVDSTSCDEQP